MLRHNQAAHAVQCMLGCQARAEVDGERGARRFRGDQNGGPLVWACYEISKNVKNRLVL
jgi:hypothetical protein